MNQSEKAMLSLRGSALFHDNACDVPADTD